MKQTFMKAVPAGMLIGISSYMYMRADNKIAAAFLFPLALIVILKEGLNLYTGKIGYLKKSWSSVTDMLTILLGNIVGAIPLLAAYSPDYQIFCQQKLANPLYQSFIVAIFCGMLMYIAVSYTDDRKNFLLTIMCVAGFLIGKCEHSIADICYFIIAQEINLKSILFLFTVIAGNSLGAVFIRNLIYIKNN